MDLVHISHPDIEALGGPVPRDSAETVWAERGWTIVDPVVAAANEAIDAPVTSNLGSLTKEQLTETAAAHGLEVDPKATKADLIALIRAAVDPGGD